VSVIDEPAPSVGGVRAGRSSELKSIGVSPPLGAFGSCASRIPPVDTGGKRNDAPIRGLQFPALLFDVAHRSDSTATKMVCRRSQGELVTSDINTSTRDSQQRGEAVVVRIRVAKEPKRMEKADGSLTPG
jgi:hypothetical protein